MIKEILNALKNDEELNNILEPSANDSKIYLNKGKNKTCIGYKLNPITSDGIKTQNKLEINCISEDYNKALEMLNRIKNILITIGDVKFNNDILNINLNGGGCLYEEDTHQHIVKAYFIITCRERMVV